MSYSKLQDASPRKLSLEDGASDSLPLYEEFQHSEGHNDVLPDAKATPMEVSDFLTHLLINTRGMSTDGARRVAALWTRGTGQELRSFPPAMYFEIFGKEDGWIVYREVHLAIHEEKKKKIGYRYGAYIALALVLCIEAIAISVSVAGFNGMTSENVAVGATMVALFGSFACLAAIVVAGFHAQSHTKYIERELSAALSKHSPQQG